MAAPTRTLKVLVADDHPIVREGLRAIVETMDEFMVVASVSGGIDAIRAAAANPPDIAVMDLHMADLDGVQATREILARNPDRLVSQKQLLQEVWGPMHVNESQYLRVYMAQLRRKLEPDPSHPKHLITEPGMGYRFQA